MGFSIMWPENKKKEFNISYNKSILLSNNKKKILNDFKQYMINNEINPLKGTNIFIDASERLGCMTTVVVINENGRSSVSRDGGIFNVYLNPFPNDLTFEFVLYHELFHYLDISSSYNNYDHIKEYKEAIKFISKDSIDNYANRSREICNLENDLNVYLKKLERQNKFLFKIISNNKEKFMESFKSFLANKHQTIIKNHLTEHACDLFSYRVLQNKGLEIDLNKILKNTAFHLGKYSHPNPYNRAKFLLNNKVVDYKINSKTIISEFMINYFKYNILNNTFSECKNLNLFNELESEYEMTYKDYNYFNS
jgi:hypothetical protein